MGDIKKVFNMRVLNSIVNPLSYSNLSCLAKNFSSKKLSVDVVANSIGFVALAWLLSGCATVVSGSKQTVTVTTPNIEGAMCSLSDSKGRVWYIEQTPGTALVKRGDGPISIICNKDGYKKGTALLEEEIAASNYGNLALLPLAPVGYFVDSATGSAERYKSSIEVTMEELPAKKPWETSYDYDSGSK
jgi:hypothetical protein